MDVKESTYQAIKKVDQAEIKQARIVYKVEHLPMLDDINKNQEMIATSVGLSMFLLLAIFFFRRIKNGKRIGRKQTEK